jgi:hypothetical protein
MKTKNEITLAAITAKYIGASNCRGSRIKVTSQRGSKIYPYPHELSGSAVFAYAAGLYLDSIKQDDFKQYGENAEGWGELSDFSHGVLPSGEHVFVRG